MRNVFRIALRDVLSGFVTPVAPAAMAGYFFLSGFFFITLVQQFNNLASQAATIQSLMPNLNEWVITPFLSVMQVILIFVVPLVAMRSFSEERQNATFELLMTSPLSSSEVVWGKTLAVFCLLGLMTLLAFLFPLSLVVALPEDGRPEVLPIVIGFVGLFLFACALGAVSVAVSACTKSQAAAGVMALVILVLLYVIDAPVEQTVGAVAEVLRYLSPTNHTEQFFKGVMLSTDIVYFLSLMLLGTFMATRILDYETGR